jgi:hypothetical protein
VVLALGRCGHRHCGTGGGASSERAFCVGVYRRSVVNGAVTHVVGEGSSFRLERSDADTTLVVTGSWTVGAGDALRSGMANGLDLNYAKGFKDTGLGFVENWPLKRVTLLARAVKDISPLYPNAPTR